MAKTTKKASKPAPKAKTKKLKQAPAKSKANPKAPAKSKAKVVAKNKPKLAAKKKPASVGKAKPVARGASKGKAVQSKKTSIKPSAKTSSKSPKAVASKPSSTSGASKSGPLKSGALKSGALKSGASKQKLSSSNNTNRTGSKIAIGVAAGAAAAGAAVAINAAVSSSAARSRHESSNQSGPSGKRQKMSINNTPQDLAPGGGIVKPATKSAPAMRLSVNDSEVLANAKERYGTKDLEMFRKLIVEQRTEAKEEFEILSQNILDTSGEFEADNQAYSLHSAEQGTDAIEREKTFLHAQRTSDYIKKLDEALERITRGTYGICIICGNLIEKQRLGAVPITQKHVDCKNKTQAKKLTLDQGFREMEEQTPGVE